MKFGLRKQVVIWNSDGKEEVSLFLNHLRKIINQNLLIYLKT